MLGVARTKSGDGEKTAYLESEYKYRSAGAAHDQYEFVARGKASLDIFWLREERLEDSDNLPEPGVIAQEIVEDLEAALEQFREIASDLGMEKP